MHSTRHSLWFYFLLSPAPVLLLLLDSRVRDRRRAELSLTAGSYSRETQKTKYCTISLTGGIMRKVYYMEIKNETWSPWVELGREEEM